MKKYKIFAGLNGGFGGAVYECIEEHENKESAELSAYQHACDTYYMHEGSGIEDWNDFYTQGESEVPEEDYDDVEDWNYAVECWATEAQRDDMESWVDYYVQEVE